MLNVHEDYKIGIIGRTSTLPKHGDIILIIILDEP